MLKPNPGLTNGKRTINLYRDGRADAHLVAELVADAFPPERSGAGSRSGYERCGDTASCLRIESAPTSTRSASAWSGHRWPLNRPDVFGCGARSR